VVTFSELGVNFVLESFFGLIWESIDWVFPLGPLTVGPAQAAVAAIAATETVIAARKNELLRIAPPQIGLAAPSPPLQTTPGAQSSALISS
jgi:hypothetical protein